MSSPKSLGVKLTWSSLLSKRKVAGISNPLAVLAAAKIFKYSSCHLREILLRTNNTSKS